MMQMIGPFGYASPSILPGLDSLREQPRLLAMKAAYERWKVERKGKTR